MRVASKPAAVKQPRRSAALRPSYSALISITAGSNFHGERFARAAVLKECLVKHRPRTQIPLVIRA